MCIRDRGVRARARTGNNNAAKWLKQDVWCKRQFASYPPVQHRVDRLWAKRPTGQAKGQYFSSRQQIRTARCYLRLKWKVKKGVHGPITFRVERAYFFLMTDELSLARSVPKSHLFQNEKTGHFQLHAFSHRFGWLSWGEHSSLIPPPPPPPPAPFPGDLQLGQVTAATTTVYQRP